MKTVPLMLTCAMLVATGGAFAQEPRSSDEIVEFFQGSANLGATRGICIGTEEQCKAKSEPQAPSGLDMAVNFELNSDRLTQDAQAKLGEYVRALKDERLRSMNFVVEGHTDASGGEAYNNSLSERRAQSVTTFLLENGVEPQRVKSIGLGETRPRAEDPYDATNRRVEMHLDVSR